MTVSSDVSALPLSILSRRCDEESRKFFAKLAYVPDYCLELFRRAIVGRDARAWDMVYRQYVPLVTRWVQHHSALEMAGEDVDYFVNRAFERMWSSVTAEKFVRFATLPGLLRFLQMCVNSSIIDSLRVSQRAETVALDSQSGAEEAPGDYPQVAEDPGGGLDRAALWQAIERQLKDEREVIVAEESFVRWLKPQEIYQDHSDQFASVSEVNKVKRNILMRLRQNQELRQFLEA